jgi:hypothetical protein
MSTAWYFAYGSNMATATLRGRRGIEFHRAVPACASGWRLVFDKPPLIAIGESFANILPDPQAEVLGVLYEIAAADLAHIDLTEGVLVGNYRRIAIPVMPLTNADGPVAAYTLTCDRCDPVLRPSQRYLELLIAGAIEHGLPEDYVARLRTVPTCAESPEAAELRATIEQFLRRA